MFPRMELIIFKSLLFSVVESSITRKYVKAGTISRTSITKSFQMLTNEVRSSIEKKFPPVFGIKFDGWSDGSGAHIVAFSPPAYVAQGSVMTPLLACAILLDKIYL